MGSSYACEIYKKINNCLIKNYDEFMMALPGKISEGASKLNTLTERLCSVETELNYRYNTVKQAIERIGTTSLYDLENELMYVTRNDFAYNMLITSLGSNYKPALNEIRRLDRKRGKLVVDVAKAKSDLNKLKKEILGKEQILNLITIAFDELLPVRDNDSEYTVTSDIVMTRVPVEPSLYNIRATGIKKSRTVAYDFARMIVDKILTNPLQYDPCDVINTEWLNLARLVTPVNETL